MEKEFNKFLEFHKVNGGTGKIFKFKLIEYREGFLKLKGEFINGNKDGKWEYFNLKGKVWKYEIYHSYSK